MEKKGKEDPNQGKSLEENKTSSLSQEDEVKQEKGDKVKVPEKFKGKTAEEIAKSYLELEKKLGQQSSEVKGTRDKLAQWEALGHVIQSNPELYQAIQKEILKISGKQSGKEKKEGSEEGKVPSLGKRDDTRVALENQIIENFENKYGINRLAPEKRKDLHLRIGRELADMLDPGGEKTYQQILSEISLKRLPRFLDKAYRLSTLDDAEERARSKAFLEAQQNQEAVIGTISASGAKTGSIQLTAQQKEVARKQGISEKDYLENLKAIREGK